jgi:DNA mismatch endonuclease (patch repair protein)
VASRKSQSADGSRTRFKSRHVALRDLSTTLAISRRMARVRQFGTAPELIVRRIATALGLRYRTRNQDLPGSPDLANRERSFAVFVHGCYWHRHANCPKSTVPKSNRTFWLAKFARNRARDQEALVALRGRGFKIAIVWECETSRAADVRRRLARLVPSTSPARRARESHPLPVRANLPKSHGQPT